MDTEEAIGVSVLGNTFCICPQGCFSFFWVLWTLRAYTATVPPGVGITRVLIVEKIFSNPFYSVLNLRTSLFSMCV